MPELYGLLLTSGATRDSIGKRIVVLGRPLIYSPAEIVRQVAVDAGERDRPTDFDFDVATRARFSSNFRETPFER